MESGNEKQRTFLNKNLFKTFRIAISGKELGIKKNKKTLFPIRLYDKSIEKQNGMR